MLRAATSDLKTAEHTVTVILDSRLAALKLPLDADSLVTISNGDKVEPALRDSANDADAVLVIAPESNGTLRRLVELVENTSAASLNSRSQAIGEVTDKGLLFHRLKALGLPTPETVQLNASDGIDAAKRIIQDQLKLPIVVKPVDGVSCGGLSVVHHIDELSAALKKIMQEFPNPLFLAQELIEGVSGSVSLIVSGNKTVPLSLNKQDVVLGTVESASSYMGGLVPLENPLASEAFETVEKTVTSLGGLAGYVGVDVVLTEEKAFVIEVNPRLTTSIVGLRKVSSYNVAQALLEATVNNKLPNSMQTKGYSLFSKVAVHNPSSAAYRRICQMPEVVSPPFPIAQDGKAQALVQSFGETVNEAALRLRETKKRLQHISRGGKT